MSMQEQRKRLAKRRDEVREWLERSAQASFGTAGTARLIRRRGRRNLLDKSIDEVYPFD